MAEQKVSHNSFSISEAIRFGWQVATKNIWFFVALILISEGISQIISFIYNNLLANGDMLVRLLGVIVFVIGWVINIEISFATFVIYFKFVDKKKTSLKDLFAYFETKLLWRYFVVSTIQGFIIILGLLLFIYPGIYFATKYWFANNIYVDKRTGIIESFKESAELTKGIKRKLFLFGLVQILVSLAGLLAVVVGLFVAIPITYLSDIYVYRKVSKTLK
ncbi:MAG TPA: hypothetical protein VND99_06140 [Candidatus Acidoferrales bacterium]|nr:hypothetical protein [Candidatus Acidoferrales bacterium]